MKEKLWLFHAQNTIKYECKIEIRLILSIPFHCYQDASHCFVAKLFSYNIFSSKSLKKKKILYLMDFVRIMCFN